MQGSRERKHAYAIVTRADGTVDVTSTPGAGSTFAALLPLASAVSAAQ